MPFTLSPGVSITETDLTTTVPQVSTSIGGMVGAFQWGPVDEITTVVSEIDVLNTFGKPNSDIFEDWFTASSFLSYSSNLKVVRVIGSSAKNSAITGALPGVVPSTLPLVKNETDYETETFANSELFVAKYPGVLGNSIRAHFADAGNYSEWKYAAQFNGAPSTSSFVTAAGGADDEMHVIVIDESGAWTGTAGTVVEKFEYVSKANDAKRLDGSSNYIGTVLQNESAFIWLGNPDQLVGAGAASANKPASTDFGVVATDEFGDSVFTTTIGAGGTGNDGTTTVIFSAAPAGGVTALGTAVISAGAIASITITNKGSGYTSAPTITFGGAGTQQTATAFMESTGKGGKLLGGVDDNAGGVTAGIRQIGVDKFVNAEETAVDLMMQAGGGVTVGKYIIDNIAETRRDLVAFVSPASTSVVANAGAEVTSIKANGTTLASSSYAFMDSSYKYQFDKYNDVFRWVPLNGDMAGLVARTDFTNDPWFSPAGFNRGSIKNAAKLSWAPTKADRDALYGVGINPIVNFTGQGITLFGDKTMLNRPSAFDRINVRRLFITIEKAIAAASKFFLFEQNDDFTRNQFKSMIEPFLRDIQGRRGITDFSVKVDATNNTPQVIDSNTLIGDIFIKPTRSINFIKLNFVAVRTGVSFSTVGG